MSAPRQWSTHEWREALDQLAEASEDIAAAAEDTLDAALDRWQRAAGRVIKTRNASLRAFQFKLDLAAYLLDIQPGQFPPETREEAIFVLLHRATTHLRRF